MMLAAGSCSAAAVQLAFLRLAALGAIHRSQGEPHGFAHVLPFRALAAAGVADPDGIYALLRVMHAQEPAHLRMLLMRIAVGNITADRRLLDTLALRVHEDRICDTERFSVSTHELAATSVECEPVADL